MERNEQPEQSRPGRSPGSTREVTALLIEDNEPLLRVYERQLEPECTVRTASDGEAALEAFSGDVDIVFLDRRMPGMDGDEVLRELRDRDPGITVVIVSGVAPEYSGGDIATRADQYLLKPVSQEALVAAIEGTLHGHEPGVLAR